MRNGYCYLVSYSMEDVIKKNFDDVDKTQVKTIHIQGPKSDHYFNVVVEDKSGKVFIVDPTWLQFLNSGEKKPLCLVGDIKTIKEFLKNKDLSVDLLAFYKEGIKAAKDKDYTCWKKEIEPAPSHKLE